MVAWEGFREANSTPRAAADDGIAARNCERHA